MAEFKCEQCEKIFTAKNNLQRHVRSIHDEEKHICEKCGKDFSRLDILARHVKTCDYKQHQKEGKRKSSDGRGRDDVNEPIQQDGETEPATKKSKTGEKVKKCFECSICGRPFNRNFNRK